MRPWATIVAGVSPLKKFSATNRSNAAVVSTKPSGTANLARASSPSVAALPPTRPS
jgi:hypothetical protein